jgi:hypothetical protein
MNAIVILILIIILIHCNYNTISTFGQSEESYKGQEGYEGQENFKSNETTSGNKIALILHVGNYNVFEEIVSKYPRFFNNKSIDLYFTCNSKIIYEMLSKNYSNAKIFLCENRGMDIGPFLTVLKYFINSNVHYNYYIKIHTKTDAKWRNEMIDPIYNHLSYFLNTKQNSIAFYGSKKWIMNGNFLINYKYVADIIDRNYPELKNKFLEYCTTNVTNFCKYEPPYFVAGTVFVFNDKYFDLLKNIKDLDFERNIMETGYSHNDANNPRKTHAWEYLFGYLNTLTGNKIIEL